MMLTRRPLRLKGPPVFFVIMRLVPLSRHPGHDHDRRRRGTAVGGGGRRPDGGWRRPDGGWRRLGWRLAAAWRLCGAASRPGSDQGALTWTRDSQPAPGTAAP